MLQSRSYSILQNSDVDHPSFFAEISLFYAVSMIGQPVPY